VVFSSALFIYGFLPIFSPLYYFAPREWRNWLILAASLLFYAAGAGTMVFGLLMSVIANQYLAVRLRSCSGTRSAILLAIGIALNLAGLLYYKYAAFIWTMLDSGWMRLGYGSLGPAPDIPLPIGISFFTFQAISYLVDVQRGEVEPAGGYSEFALYHTLFPQLVAGPIVRYTEIREEVLARRITAVGVAEGVCRFCIGFGKKMILADNLGSIADQIIALPASELTPTHAWLGMVCYSLQIFYDFSGYSDMAIGLGKMLGFDFPENFDQPYRASSVTEFWRRWHMTLTRWFRDYLYIPLGGNRRGAVRTYLNLLIVFCLCGLWHGAGFGFLIWGLYHGALLVGERLADHQFGWRPSGAVGTAATFVLVTVGWVFFRIDNIGAALDYLATMMGLHGANMVYFGLGHYLTSDTTTYLLAAIVLALIPSAEVGSLRLDRTELMVAQTSVSMLVFGFAALQLAANSFNPFIYFRF
jgi:alginate O-acetyltransferase complex protein AlgI